jgi:EAL domain-containing protein (putative c-di-GMP-specific phosphodiesterase class I)/GAF domain-containing protein
MTKLPEAQESARLDALHQLNLLDTAPSESFDRITRMAARIFDLPIAAVSLTDRDRQWFKSRVGVDHCSIPRERAPCGEVAEFGDFVLIPDLLEHPCYKDSVLAQNGTRFYAGAPLVTRDGHGLGALCVLGVEPRETTEEEIEGLKDLAAMVMAQIELQHAFGRIDPVSGLPNRTQFLDDLSDLARDHSGERRLAVLVDLVRPDQLNSAIRALGPSHLDEMVRAAARLIRSMAGRSVQVYQVAATQFAFVAPEETEEETFLAVVQGRLSGAADDADYQIIASLAVGVVPFVCGSLQPEDILRSAYGAALDARSQKSRVCFHSTSNDSAHRRRFRLLHDFEAAMADTAQLRLVVQPRIDIATRTCAGVEALLRWRHPEFGDVAPLEFVPLVEHTSLARSLTAWVIDRGLADLKRIGRAGHELQMSVNIFAANLEEPDFASRVQLCLKKHDVPPELLELEITEGAAIANTSQSVAQLEMLAEGGVRIAIDDFGTGYSSLAYLQSLPATVVKIDQSFVRGIDRDERAAALVRSMIGMSRGLGYHVVAEGVEDLAVLEMLQAMECEEAQGFYFARPMEWSELRIWLRRQAIARRAAA